MKIENSLSISKNDYTKFNKKLERITITKLLQLFE